MGSDFDIMKFAEGDNELKLSSFTDFIISAFSLIVLSPFRLLHEISIKVIFIKRDLVKKVLIVATITSMIFIVFDIFLSLFIQYEGSFLTDDILIYSVGTIILGLMTYLYHSTQIMLYDQLEKMFPNNKPELEKCEQVKQENGETIKNAVASSLSKKDAEKKRASDEVSEPETVTSMNDLTPVSQKDLAASLDALYKTAQSETTSMDQTTALNDTAAASSTKDNSTDDKQVEVSEDVLSYINRYNVMVDYIGENSKMYCGALSEDEIEAFSAEMEKCTDPSKFINNELIQMFNENAQKEDLSFLADLDLSIIPDSYSILT